MLESFAAWLLNTYIGDYFGNVNTDQLRMSLHSGEIELERLPLKRDLIKHLGLPLEASTGYIGKISIKFPRWHLFTSEPLVITIDELYLLVKPITNFTYNEEEENRAQQEFKMSQLDMLEQRWKALHEEESQNSSYYSSSYSSWLRVANYGSSFFTNILLNVHLKVSSIHLRYEDQATIPGCPFATGVLIRSLSVCSTDEHWTPKYVTREALADQHHNLLFKAIELESFAVYFDTDTGLYQNPKDKTSVQPPLSSLVEHMRANVERNRSPTGALFDHNYIIAPVNGRAHLKRNSSELSLKSCRSPRTVIDVQLEQVPIMMTAVQYKHLLDWSLAFQTSKTLWRYRKWRPMISRRSNRRSRRQRLKSRSSRSRTVSIEEGLNLEAEELEEEEEEEFEEEEEDEEEPRQNRSSSCRPGFDARTWWHFAVNANLEEYRQRRQRFNWAFILRRARDVVAYHAAYLHYLITPELYGKEMRAVKERVEAELSLDEICSIREVVFAESDRLLREQQQQQQQQLKPYGSAEVEVETSVPENAVQSGSWFFPYSLLSNMYYSYGTSSSSSTAQPSQSTEVSPTEQKESAEEVKEEAKKKKKHRRNLSTSSTGSFGSPGTDDIFLLRDAVFCQFNFQIRNSSFQLIAFNSLDGGESGASSSAANNSSSSSSSSSGNLLLEFEFNKMAIGVDITNPNAYACVCHMNQGWRRRAQQPQQQQDPKQTSPSKAFLTQNELNMLQFNLAFECRHLELTLLRTEGAPIISSGGAGSAEASRLATAQLTGCGLVFVFSSHFVSIDGRLDSLEILDLVGAGSENRHRRVLSIGAAGAFEEEEKEVKESLEMVVTEVVAAAASSGEDRSFRGGGFQNTSSELEKAFSFGLSRTFTENVLRLNILMASFVYVHSPVLVAEISRCRECFSDVLEAYFSRSFKERVKAATTEMLRGIVKTAANASSPSADNSTSGDTSKGDGSFKTELGPRTAQKLSLGTKGVRGGGPVARQKPKSQQISPFIDNFKLNIFISSPVIIFPISPASYEVVVCHLGHMLLNNHSHSSELMMSSSSSKKNSRSQVMMMNGGLKYSTFSSPNISSSSANSASGSSTSTSTNSDSYNAEIRDLSVYSLDCARNIAAFEELSLQQGGGGGKTPKEKGVRGLCSEAMPMAELYACEPFGVPILSKTVVEIVLEKKVLMSSLMTEGTGTGAYGRPLSSRLSTSPQPPPHQKRSSSEVRSLPVVPKTSTSSTASGGSGGQEDSVLIDGLNIISTVNSIDAFRPPKKFSIRSHMVSSDDNYYQHQSHHHHHHHQRAILPKPELVLSVDVSSIDVRFSYTDVLVFLHILNTLVPGGNSTVTTSSKESSAPSSSAISAGKKDEPKKDDEEEEDSALNMEELEELFRGELQRQRRKSSAAAKAALEEGKMKRKPSTTEDQPPKLSDLDPAQFKLALDKLQDLGFEYGESLRALALTSGDVIEAAFMLSSSGDRKNEKEGEEKEAGNSDGDAHSQCTTRSADLSASNTEKSASYQNLLLMGGANSAAQAGDAMSNSTTTTMSQGGTASRGASAGSGTGRKKAENSSSSGSSLLSSLSVIELRVASGTIRIIDDCNQLDIPLVELGVREARLLQQNGSPVIEATAQLGAAYCDLYNSHLGGWEPVVEEGARVAASWKIHHQRAQLKSMVASSGRGSGAGQGGHQGYKAARRKLALKVDVKRMVNLNVSRTMLDMVEKVQRTWVADIAAWMALPPERRCFRKRSPFIPFALKNETGSDVQLLLPSGGSGGTVRFSAGKGPDLVTHCDPRESIEASAGQVVCFDIVDTREQLSAHSGQSRWSRAETSKSSSSSKRLQTQKITVKVDGWSATPFPLSIEREGTFVRHIVSELYFKQSAVLVFDIALQPTTAVKLITVRSSLQVLNKTTKNVELSFANTAALGPKDERRMQTRYIIAPGGVLPVPLKLLYARMQLRPCDLGLGACRTPINWSHVRRYGEQQCSLQICTPITHSSAASYSASAPYVVTVLVERNSIGALVESRRASSVQNGNVANGINATNSSSASMNSLANGNFEGSAVSNVYGHTPLVTIPSHTITLLPPLQLANRLPYELKFVISSSSNSSSSSSGSSSGSFSHHHHSSSSSSSNSSATQTSGVIKSGEDHSVHYVSPLEPFTVELSMEHFPRSKPLLITPGATKDYTAAVDIYDANGRLLVLQAAVTVVAGRGGPSGGALGALGGALGGGGSQPCNAMTITLYSPYWIVNRSGLPLIFAQEGVYVEAAGQGEEHERARALSPLLYSHAEAEAPKFAVMRLGRMTEAVEPRWCNYFLLEKGTFYRRLRVTECAGPVGGRSGSVNSFDPLTASPGRAHAHYFPPATEKIYEFGIDIRSGRDRYSNTKIVTIAPRYQIENLTTYRLEFAQKCMVDGSLSSNSSTGYHSNQSSFSGSEYGGSPIGHRGSFAAHRSSFGGGYLQQQQQQIISMSSATSAISALPKSNTPFHWPATDSPKLLVVRISSLPGCAWSGAFTVGAEPSASFHLNIRDDSGRSFFLRVEILLQSATYFIVFTEANQLPPPVRVENFSQVPIEFYQAGTTSLLQRTRVRPNSSIPYALDEPLLPSHLTVAAPGGACSTYDLNSFAPGDSLTYDNFYYIAFEETFAQATAFGFGGGGGFYGTGYLAHDLDDDEQLMLMMLAGGGGGGGGGDLMDDNDLSLGPGAQMLVLDVPDGTEYLSFQGGEHFGLSSSPPTAEMKPVLLTRKERGKRSQLWRIDVHSRIIHEGSCPPVEPGSAGLREHFSSTADLGFADVKFGGGSRSGGNGGGGLYHHRSSTMVLDVADEGGACYDGTALPLVIRRLHPARERTQTWHWTADGRLRCAKYEHLFVAPRGASPASSSSTSSSESSNLGAIFRSGNAACLVLGPMEVKQSGSSTAAAAAAGSSAIQIPRTQAVLKQKMRKGSGVLNVSIQADGPSRVLRIRDQQMSANGRHLRHQQQQQAFLSVGGSPLGLGHFGVERSSTAEEASSAASAQGESALVRLLRSTELELSLAVDAVGVSVISAANEELIYLFLRRISLEATLNPAECRLRAVVMNFQVDNQLRHCEKEVVLHVGSLNALEGNGGSLSTETAFERDAQELVLASSSSITPPAITFIAQKLFIPNVETNVFKNLQVSINDLVLNLEEVVLLKLLEFIQYDPVDSEMDEISSAQSGSSSSSASSSTGADALYHANSRNVSSSLARSAQYYFAYLLVQLSSVKLSVFTSGAHRVGAFLSELKKKAGIKLIRFEDALIQLRPYHRVYSLMTRRFLTDSIKEHYRAELRSQAAKILGTVDFLGNPVGFLNDMADGISDLTRGNLSGLLWSVTHGISDSTAKFTSVLGESLGTVTMDARYQEIRRKIKQESSAAAGGQRGHLSAGALGLAHGLIGGITSLITQTYDGFTQGSVTGVLSGLGKGVLGTITKPAVGVLDFASSAATAVRDSSRKTTGTTASDGSGAWEVGGPVRRVRRPRTLTIDGRLTAYDAVQAAWQARFYSTGDFGPREYGEAFVAVTLLQDGHLVMVTTERLLFFHSLTLKRADLEAASAQEEGDLEGDSRLLAENVHHHLAATDCPVNQLQILALETISEAVHARMRPRDAQRFYRLNGLPAGSSALCLGELFSLHADAELVSLLELRTTTATKKIINKGGGGGSGANSPRMSASSTSLEEEQLRETGVEYPKALQLCYLYASSPEVMDRLVGLINEAKHLQEERKFEVGVLEGSSNK